MRPAYSLPPAGDMSIECGSPEPCCQTSTTRTTSFPVTVAVADVAEQDPPGLRDARSVDRLLIAGGVGRCGRSAGPAGSVRAGVVGEGAGTASVDRAAGVIPAGSDGLGVVTGALDVLDGVDGVVEGGP